MAFYLVHDAAELELLGPPCDLFVAAAADEPRGLAASQRLRFGGAPRAVLLDFGGGSTAIAAFERALPSHACEAVRVRPRDAAAMTQIADGLDPNAARVCIDITSFPVEDLAVFLKRMRERGFGNVTVVYTFPGAYPSWTPEPTRLHELSDEKAGALVGFYGDQSPTLQRLLVIQLGFETERARSLIDELAPDHLIAVLGFPPLSAGWHQRSLTENREVLRMADAVRVAAADDVVANAELLDQIANDFERTHSLNVCPLGTKVQALGAILHALRRPATALVSDFPLGPTANYSTGTGRTVGYVIRLSSA